MASSEAWGQGWALGSQIAGEQRQHKQALSDEEFQQKASDLVENRKAIQAKLPTLLDENGKPTPEYNQAINDLTANAHDLRELYHPDKNPGMIAKYGHILTDSLHLTNAKDREQKAEAKQEAGAASDKYSALSWAGAAPISPAQTAMADAKSKEAVALEMMQGKMKMLKTLFPNATPEQMQSWQNDLATSITGAKPIADKYFKDLATTEETLPDGSKKMHYWRVPLADEPPQEVDFNGQVLQPKKSPSADQPIRAWTQDKTGKVYSVLLDRKTNQAIPGSENYTLLPPPYLTPRVSSGIYHWVDENNQIHATPETHTSHAVLPNPAATPSTTNQNTPPSTPATVRQKAQAAGAPSNSSTRASVPAIKDRILGYKSSAPLNHARQIASDAGRLSSLADILGKRAAANPNGMSEADGQFVLSLIRSEAGRVNQQEIAQIFNAGGIAEMPERWAAKAGHGQLSTNLRNELIQFAHDMKQAADDAVKELVHSPDQPGQSANPDIDAIVNIINQKHAQPAH